MVVTIEKAGRVVIPEELRDRLDLEADKKLVGAFSLVYIYEWIADQIECLD